MLTLGEEEEGEGEGGGGKEINMEGGGVDG